MEAAPTISSTCRSAPTPSPFSHDGFQAERLPSILVQANRTATLNVSLKVGQVGTTIDVEAAPAMNAVDTTNGYILEKDQIDQIPLPTGSFTGLAILSPGVNAELPNGTGANAGLGNQPIWANGQRDTSNTFLLNGVDASNLFNGKSTSQVASARIVNNTGVSGAGSTTAQVIQSTASPYLAIGQALPTPAPETVQEFRVNTSMYDAQQGSTSGAHIDMSTASGTNTLHGQAYFHRGKRLAERRAVFLQSGSEHSQQREGPAVAPLHRGRNPRRGSDQGQAVRFCQLSAHSRVRLGDWNFAHGGADRTERRPQSDCIGRRRPEQLGHGSESRGRSQRAGRNRDAQHRSRSPTPC